MLTLIRYFQADYYETYSNMNIIVFLCVLFIFVFIVGYYESQVSSRSVQDQEVVKVTEEESIKDDSSELDETMETSIMFKFARLLAVVSVVVGLFKLAYPDHLRL